LVNKYVVANIGHVNVHVAPCQYLPSGCQWRHCPGHLNPADMPSRGLLGNELFSNEPWWNGPTFLQLPEDDWPSMMTSDTCEEAHVEIKKT